MSECPPAPPLEQGHGLREAVELDRPSPNLPSGTGPTADPVSQCSPSSPRPRAGARERYQVRLLEQAWAEEAPKVRADPIRSPMKRQKKTSKDVSSVGLRLRASLWDLSFHGKTMGNDHF